MISVFDLFSIGIGPSSSHTVGPMRAACAFVNVLKQADLLPKTDRVVVECYGSLGQTGKGHGTGKAIILGLAGFEPESVDIEAIPAFLDLVEHSQSLLLRGERPSLFPRVGAIIFNRRKTLPAHSNGMTLRAFAADALLFEQTYYSIGGGFIIEESHFANAKEEAARFDAAHPIPYPFESGAQLLAHCQESGLSISGLMLANEKVFRTEAEIKAEYFDGNVKSIGFEQNSEKATVGVMDAGDYLFNTAAPERMTVIKGALTIQLADEDEWHSYGQGQSFDVAGHSSFKLVVKTPTAYLCEFLD